MSHIMFDMFKVVTLYLIYCIAMFQLLHRVGVEVSAALQAAEELQTRSINARVVDMFTIKPIDEKMVIECATKTGAIVTAENHNIIGGLGSAVAEVLAEHRPCIMHRIGIDESLDKWVQWTIWLRNTI